MAEYCSTGQSPQRAVVLMEEEEGEEEEEEEEEESSLVTLCTTGLTFKNSTFCPHSVFMCFVWI
jgi:hypothetical protein